MANAYLSTVSSELDSSLSNLMNLRLSINELLEDLPHINGLDGYHPVALLENSLQSVDETIFQINKVKDFILEAINNG